jgi:hypothetical protein
LVPTLRSRRDLALENIALRQQLMVLQRVWPGWRRALLLVQPATVVGWHRKGFRAYWRWKSRARGGRPRIDPSVRSLIRHMWNSNPTWGSPRIQAELHKLGIDVSDATVRRYRPSRLRPPSQAWHSFLENHLTDIAAMDFFNVTTSPSAHWTAQQVVVLNEGHMLRVLRGYASYYHASRAHRSLDGDCSPRVPHTCRFRPTCPFSCLPAASRLPQPSRPRGPPGQPMGFRVTPMRFLLPTGGFRCPVCYPFSPNA